MEGRGQCAMTETANTNLAPFAAETGQLLDILVHALYSDRRVFLRELIANGVDACEKLRHLVLTGAIPDSGIDHDFVILLETDPKARRLVIGDNGVGMSGDEMAVQLGTIARSGTKAFLESARAGGRAPQVIGQFGVGFYAAWLVAERVEVFSRRAGTEQTWRWESDGRSGYRIEPVESNDAGPAEHPRLSAFEGSGTRVVLHLRREEGQWTELGPLEQAVQEFADHIGVPVRWRRLGERGQGKLVNRAKAIWTEAPKDVSHEAIKPFYQHVAHASDTPFLTVHTSVEGLVTLTMLIFAPSERPRDLYYSDYLPALRLYARRVLVLDRCAELVPAWLRFLSGVVDCEDLPLKLSRDGLASNAQVGRIRTAIIKRVLDGLEAKAESDREGYHRFWEGMGPVLKEGLYHAPEYRERLLRLARFRSSRREGWISLDEYRQGMVEGQKEVSYLIGDSPPLLASSPHLEGFRARGLEVLLLTDAIDDFWLPQLAEGGTSWLPFRSASRGTAEFAGIAQAPSDQTGALDSAALPQLRALVTFVRGVLGDAVKDVQLSARLRESSACLVADAGDPDLRLARMLRAHEHLDRDLPRVLELNPNHEVICALAERLARFGDEDGRVSDSGWLLLDQARLASGDTPLDLASFSGRMTRLLVLSLADSSGLCPSESADDAPSVSLGKEAVAE